MRSESADVAAVRRFNRFYTRRIGVLEEGLLASRFSLAEVRVLYEIAARQAPAASELSKVLGLDPGYLSRLLSGLARRELVARERALDDGRRSLLALTVAGREVLADLQARADAEVAAMLDGLAASDRCRLLAAMASIEGLLAGPAPAEPLVLRTHEPGDLGWIVCRHGTLYTHEHGWDDRFEGLVATIAGDFLTSHDPRRERAWIAELGGERVGSVLLVADDESVARLRLLLVEPAARGRGVGTRLVDECTRFARRAGYRAIRLWTNAELGAARRIYQRAGYRLISEEPHRRFGPASMGQSWELDLA
jgi:DNA-binding MarR family transcriptional regulator/GNAT superfamily N-acetyltransferase